MVELETMGSSPGPSSGDTTSVSPPVPTTTPTVLTTTPQPTTGDPLDTGVLDTGGLWLDLPEDCSIFDQDCPPGYKCMPWANDGGSSWNDSRCVPLVEDPNGPGEPCTVEGTVTSGLDDCDITSMCWDVDPDTLEGTCVPHCIGDPGDPTCADRCDRCSMEASGVLALCLPTCDPILQNCIPGQACYPIGEIFTCAPDASPPMTGIGSPCGFVNVCPPGLLCMDGSMVPDCAGNEGCCTPACPVQGADPCPGLLPGTVCTAWYADGIPDDAGCLTAEPGVCVTP